MLGYMSGAVMVEMTHNTLIIPPKEIIKTGPESFRTRSWTGRRRSRMDDGPMCQ